LLDQKAVRNSIQWVVTPGDDVADSTTGSYTISRYNNAGVKVDEPLTINRQTGDVILLHNLNVGKDLVLTGNISKTGNLTINTPNLVASAAFSAASAAISGALTAGSGAITGTLTVGSTLTAPGATINGTLTATTLVGNTINSNGNIAAAAQISSNTMITNGLTSNGNLNVAGLASLAACNVAGYPVWTQSIMPAINVRTAGGLYDSGVSTVVSVPSGFLIEQIHISGGFLRAFGRQLQWQGADGAWRNVALS